MGQTDKRVEPDGVGLWWDGTLGTILDWTGPILTSGVSIVPTHIHRLLVIQTSVTFTLLALLAPLGVDCYYPVPPNFKPTDLSGTMVFETAFGPDKLTRWTMWQRKPETASDDVERSEMITVVKVGRKLAGHHDVLHGWLNQIKNIDEIPRPTLTHFPSLAFKRRLHRNPPRRRSRRHRLPHHQGHPILHRRPHRQIPLHHPPPLCPPDQNQMPK